MTNMLVAELGLTATAGSVSFPLTTLMSMGDALLTKKNCTPHELLERIKVMSARKRGPRKGSVRTPQVQLPELAVAS